MEVASTANTKATAALVVSVSAALLRSHIDSYLAAGSDRRELLPGARLSAWVERRGDHQMRDIRGDLQDRAKLIAEQISATQGQYDAHIEKLKSEHQTILEDLKSALHNVHMVIGFEGRRVGSSVPATEAVPQASRHTQHHPQQAQSHQPPSDALARKVASVGFR